MTWKQTLRTLESAAKQAERELLKGEKKLQRIIKQVRRKVEKLDEQMGSDIIDAFNLRYNEKTGLTWEPVDLSVQGFSGRAEFSTTPVSAEKVAAEFEPERYAAEGALVEPKGLLAHHLTTLLVVEVDHSNEDYRLPLDWVSSREPENSRVYLVDTVNNEYYYPSATNLKGEVVANRPRVGLVAFDPFRIPTDTVEAHFSKIKLGPGTEMRETITFAHHDPDLSELIEDNLEQPGVMQAMTDALEEEVQAIRQPSEQDGCIVLLAGLSGALSVIAGTGWKLLA